jgi:hypothetical protein
MLVTNENNKENPEGLIQKPKAISLDWNKCHA